MPSKWILFVALIPSVAQAQLSGAQLKTLEFRQSVELEAPKAAKQFPVITMVIPSSDEYPCRWCEKFKVDFASNAKTAPAEVRIVRYNERIHKPLGVDGLPAFIAPDGDCRCGYMPWPTWCQWARQHTAAPVRRPAPPVKTAPPARSAELDYLRQKSEELERRLGITRELDERVTRLESRMDSIETKIDDLRGIVLEMRDSIGEMASRYDRLVTHLGLIEEELKAIPEIDMDDLASKVKSRLPSIYYDLKPRPQQKE